MRKFFVVGFLLFVTFSALAQGLQDTTLQIEEVEIVAKRIFKKESAGMRETQVDTLILQQKATLSLSHLLSEHTSVFIKDHGRGALATASFRGTASSHTQVNWNGLPINSPMLGMVDFSLIPVYIIDDLTLQHGSASIAQQSGGLGGSINLGNRPDWSNTFGVKYLQGIGSYSTFDEFIQLGGGTGRIQLRTRLYHNFSKNDYPFLNRAVGSIDPSTGEIVHPMARNENADFTRYGLLQEAYLRVNPQNVISFKYWGQQANRTLPKATSYEGPDNSNLNKQYDTDHKAVIDWKRYSGKGKWSLTSGYTQKGLVYSLTNSVPGLGQIPAIYSESTHKALLNTASYSYNFGQNTSLESSVSYNYHDVISNDTVQGTGYAQHRNELFTFVALRKSFWERLNLNLMLRQDWVDGLAAPFVPYFGFDYKILKEKDLSLKGNIARNHHQPTLNDLYWQPGGNPELLPEQGISAELGFASVTKVDSHLLEFEITTYRSHINNWIIWVPTFKGYWEPLNIKKVLSQGAEFHLSSKGSLGTVGYMLSGTYAYTQSINYGDPLVWGDESYGKQLVYVPLHSGNAMVRITFRGYHMAWQHTSYSERFTTSSNKVSRRDWLYPYFMNDLSLGKELLTQKFRLSAELRVQNLFNETYHSVLYRPMAGRNFMLLLTIGI